MTYFCFIESEILTVPHMEPLLATAHEDAIVEARDLMGLHSSAIAAHIFDGEERVATVRPDGQIDEASLMPARRPPSGDKHPA